MNVVNTGDLAWIAETEFRDLVAEVFLLDINQLRISLYEESFVDIWYSLKLFGRYSYHWERRAIDGMIYRHDNAPYEGWKNLSTYPAHFHNGSEANAVESWISADPETALRQFLSFVRTKLRAEE